MTKIILATAVMAVTAITSGQALAAQREAGDIIIRAGAATVSPDDETSDNLRAVVLGESIDLGGDVSDIDDDTQLGLTLTWMINDQIGLGLLAATPFEHDIEVEGEKVGSTKQLPPTLSLQYHPMGGGDSRFQPYVGLGVNYTHFFDEDASSELESAFGEKVSMDVDDSWGMAVQLGADYFITDSLALNAAVWKIQMETDAEFKTTVLDEKVKIEADDIEIDPWVWMVGLGYRF